MIVCKAFCEYREYCGRRCRAGRHLAPARHSHCLTYHVWRLGGYRLPSRTVAMHFFQLTSRRYEHAFTVLTSNRSLGE
jgi:hypothetical protein